MSHFEAGEILLDSPPHDWVSSPPPVYWCPTQVLPEIPIILLADLIL